jgi:hypothetical protein
LRGIADEHGVQPLAHWVMNGVIYCVQRAPSRQAFCRHHAAHGLPCDDVHWIASADTDIARVVAELWPGDQRVDIASRGAAASLTGWG